MVELFTNLTKPKGEAATSEPTGEQSAPAADSTLGSNEGATEDQTAEEPADEEDGPIKPQVDELEVLKLRARTMGITFSNNIGLDALRKKIEAKMNAEPETPETPADDTDDDEPNEDPVTETISEPKTETKPVKARKMTARQYLQQDALKLIRVRITNLDPKKANLPGEVLTVANGFIGTVRKFVPYGEVTENGYHVPNCLVQMMKERQFLMVRDRKGSNGRTYQETTMEREFAIEVLEPLSEKELAQLAAAQAAKGGVE